MIHVRCQCGRRLQVVESYVGKAGPCPACGQPVRLVAATTRGGDDFDHVLVIEKGPDRIGEQLFLGGTEPLELGKLPDKPLYLADASVSRNHCRLTRADDGWRIEDLGSRNGVLVNGVRVRVHALREGELIRVGHYAMRYRRVIRTDPPAPTTRAEAHEELYALTALEDTAPVLDAVRTPVDGPSPSSGGARTDRADVDAGVGPICPCCRKTLPFGARICVECGVDLRTGRAVLTSHDADLDRIYDVTEGTVRWLSWLIPSGIYPVASEAFGTRRPYVIWTVAAVTVLASIWFLALTWFDAPAMREHKNLMLWCGRDEPDARLLVAYYMHTAYGDRRAFETRLQELKRASLQAARVAQTRPAAGSARPAPTPDIPSEEQLVIAAHRSLSPAQQCVGHYRPAQLVTHALLHGGILHLAGNLLFLFVFGSRVNALIGNVATAVLYLLLAIAAGLAHMHAVADGPPQPMVGASGAIMGLAGMYLVLLPLHKVHMAAWFRWGLIGGFRLHSTVFAIRGFWVVLFYIAFDVVFTLLAIHDATAHWAHLGGFLVGAAVAFMLLLSRVVNCRGGDLLSAILGPRAWPLVGRPGRRSITLP